MTGSLLSGCGSDGGVKPEGAAGETQKEASDGGAQPKGAEYPASITYWVGLNGNAGATMKSYNGIAAYKEIEKLTGTKVEFQHPPAGQESDQFNLVFSSSKMPDVIEYTMSNIPKGPDNAIKEKRILRLNELIEEHAPNLKAILEANPEYKKLITTDDGNIYVFPFIRGDELLLTYHGPTIRKDWLDKLNLSVPETIDEWEQVLKAFRDQDPNGNGKKDEIPFLLNIDELNTGHAFIGAYGITNSFYHENGQVKFGPMQPEYKQFLTTMNRWYKEGLIDKDYALTDAKLRDAKVTGNQLGSLITYAGSGVGRFNDLMKEQTPDFVLAATPYPALEKGGKSIGQMEFPFAGVGASITASAKEPEKIAKWLDLKYSEEGHLLFNFGIEGESYTMKDGYPTYTDQILHNPDGLPITQAMAQYFTASWSGPFIQDRRYVEQYYATEVQRNALDMWMQADHSKLMPPTTMTADESAKYASIMNDIDTYHKEMLNKFIIGSESLDNFDAFTSKLSSMGIEEAIKLKQNALDRFNQR
ncbi:extracellular solute-binding protein [Paenibacillus sp. GCM10027626]|uniref:extracellular solute-binding protein n=1 Tax=Paenibacillus sp. GCM10027626 TaxID=3273411 RepID=UPI00362A6FF4